MPQRPPGRQTRLARALVAVIVLMATLAPTAEAQDPALVVVSEIFYNPDGQDEGHEFVELLNAGGEPADLTGWQLTDGIDLTFGPGTSLAPGERLIATADLAAFEIAFGAPADAAFVGTLANGGERLVLVDAAGITIDEVLYDDVAPWPTTPDGSGDSLNLLDPANPARDASNWVAGTPTPGDIADPMLTVLFSLERGWYDGDQTVTLTTVPGATIRYSTSAALPSQSYAGPITVTDNGAIRTIRAQAVKDGQVGDVVTHTYVFRPDEGFPLVVTWPSGQSPVNDDRLAISFEFIPPPSVPLTAAGQNAGFLESSGGGAAGFHDKIYFRGAYGAGTFAADLFGDHHYGLEPATQHDQLFLRDWVYSSPINQIMAHDALLDMGQLSPHGRFVGYYESGTWLGPRHLQERPEAGFMESYTDIDKDEWQAWSAAAPVPTGSGWNWFRQTIDPEQFLDFHINQWFANATDFRTNRNYRSAGPAGATDGDVRRWRFFNWDLDGAYGYNNLGYHYPNSQSNANNWGTGTAWQSPAALFGTVQALPEVRRMLGDRVHCSMLDADGALTLTRIFARLDDRKQEFEQIPLTASHPHWPQYTQPFADWRVLMDTWLPARHTWMIGQYRAAGYLQQRGAVEVHLDGNLLTFTDPNQTGDVWYRLDGGDVRTETGTLAAEAIRYSGPIELSPGRHTVVARSHDPGQAADLERFSPACADGVTLDVQPAGGGPVGAELVITEIHYNPTTIGNVDGDLREFVEIANPGLDAVNLTGFELQGVSFTFGPGSTIQPGQRLIIAADAAAFAADHGIAADLIYPGRLDDGGERIALVTADGQVVDEVVYDDVEPWPRVADGGGHSLELDRIDDDNSLAISWRPSFETDGSPRDPNAPAGDVSCDTAQSIIDALLIAQYTVGIRETATCPLPNASGELYAPAGDVNRDGQTDIVDALLISRCEVAIANIACRD